MTLTKEQSNTLKWLAIVLMLIDHIGAIFFPTEMMWRIIGRLAFPLFAYQLATGIDFTRSPMTQLRNLFVFGLISQVPYMYAFQPVEWKFNIFITLAIGYAIILCIKEEQWLFVPLLIGMGWVIPVDYGFYGVLLPVLFYFLKSKSVLLFIAVSFATILHGLSHSILQVYAILAIPLILLTPHIPTIRIQTSKWFFYWFYPVHLTALVLINKLL